uniref:Uncharacterized protein n=1 Tax=Anguilla anguilla TaxID=7936 RepID=A0A0E9R3N3_ANGAN
MLGRTDVERRFTSFHQSLQYLSTLKSWILVRFKITNLLI